MRKNKAIRFHLHNKETDKVVHGSRRVDVQHAPAVLLVEEPLHDADAQEGDGHEAHHLQQRGLRPGVSVPRRRGDRAGPRGPEALHLRLALREVGRLGRCEKKI